MSIARPFSLLSPWAGRSRPSSKRASILNSVRFYREQVRAKGLVSFEVSQGETDLHISASKDVKRQAEQAVLKCRSELEGFIKTHPIFLTTLTPFKVAASAPAIVKRMAEAAQAAGVGPMAAVAGAVAEWVGRDLTQLAEEVIVENGGDIFLKTLEVRRMGIYAGSSPLSEKVALLIRPEQTPLGVCTSSGTVGHSLSFGRADAVVVLAKDTALADAVATAVGNRVRTPEDIEAGVAFAQGVAGLQGVLVIIGEKIGMWGEIELA